MKGAITFLLPSLAMSCMTARVNVSGEVKCRSLEGDDLCPKLSHLETGVTLSPTEDWDLKLSYDFAQSRKASWYDSLDLKQFNLPPQKSWLADYGIRHRLDERFTFAIEDTSGTTLIPDASHLAYSTNLQDAGWKQTAARLSFNNKEIFEADILLGLGEGERLSSDDGDIYYGARARWYLAHAVGLQFAYSDDQNSLNKDAIYWISARDDLRKGFASERFATSLILNGKLPYARGLEASLGWQRNVIRSDRPAEFSSAPTDLAFDPTESLTQALGGLGVTKRESLYYSLSYRILSEYIVAFHGSDYKSRMGEAVLVACDEIDATGACVGSTDEKRSFRLRERTYGLGKLDEDGWSVLLESHEERYDRLYQNFHFLNGRSPRQKNMRVIQARIAWNW
ncbi:MAG: hypothetical protein EOP10_20220 [Proteobacteria bacterium]|nr:MAG: hypothetical protein EOP10_20220 [Pseudomonadota bacterium]